MKGSLLVSTALHGLVLTWALWTAGAPAPMQVADVEALPVDIIPVESITQIQEGDREAQPAERAAPTPTTRPEPVEDAQTVGDNTVDLDTPPSPDPAPTPSESAAAPEAAERPAPVPEPDPAPEPEPAEAPPAEPTSEVAALPEPAATVEPDPAPEPEASEPEPAPEFAALPERVPTPDARPQPPQAQTAQTPQRRQERQREPRETASSAKESDFNADQIAALLNKQEPAGGGAQRSDEQAALGGNRTTRGETLTQSEMDALRGQIQRCWSIIPGIADGGEVRVQVTMRLDPSGGIEGQPAVTASGGSEAARRTLSGGALRAVLRCAPYDLPAEKYESWSDVVVNFDPSQMF